MADILGYIYIVHVVRKDVYENEHERLSNYNFLHLRHKLPVLLLVYYISVIEGSSIIMSITHTLK